MAFLHKNITLFCFLSMAFLSASTPTAQTTCPNKCGDISIPYPFGIQPGCFLSQDFSVNCTSETPFLVGSDPLLEIHSISIDTGELVVHTPAFNVCYDVPDVKTRGPQIKNLTSSKFPFSTRNRFTAVGCDTLGLLLGDDYITGCLSYCNNQTSVDNSSCSGAGCCQTTNLTTGQLNFVMSLSSISNHSGSVDFNPCDYAFLGDSSYVFHGAGELMNFGKNRVVQTVLDWAIGDQNCLEAQTQTSDSYACKGAHSICVDSKNGPGYNCQCSPGFEGNPYKPGGCEDVCEHRTCKSEVIKLTVGIAAPLLIVLVAGSFMLWRYAKKKKMYERKNKFFRQNGGPLLQDSLDRVEDAQSAFKIFTAEEMEAATNGFDEDRIIGCGGFGVVYKGFLSDGRVVAIKKSKSVDQYEIDQFINEVVLLSKIQHQNVVGFYGCCLETPQPLLVYEFITNGSLLDHLYREDNNNSVLPWEIRLKIAAETAGVLGYLHQDHRPMIIHSDIKPHNILLDDNYNAKVSDFGISKSVAQNETELYTKVKGTLGYLDPEFIQCGQLTEKSDVYSFGVVLLELLTGQRVLSFDRSDEDRTLVAYFQSSVGEGNIMKILDEGIIDVINFEELRVLTRIAGRCVSVKADERPTMKEVAMELGSLWMEVKHRDVVQSFTEERRSTLWVRGAENTDGNTGTSNGFNSSTEQVFLDHLSGGR